jgi:hypothetical protein
VKLLRHLVATDLRQFRLVLAGWIAVLAFAALLHGLPSSGDYDPTGLSPTAVARSLLSLVQTVLLLAIVPLVMHAHPAVGTRAFWMTRPLPVPTLIASKFVLLGGVVLAAIAANAILMAVYDVAPRMILPVSIESAFAYVFLVLMLLVVAAWTPDLWRFAVVIVSIFAAFAASLTLIAMVLIRRTADTPMSDVGFGINDAVFIPLYLLTALAALYFQYRTRLLSRSIPLAAAGCFIAITAAWAWPRQPVIPRTAPEFASAGTEVVADASSIETQTGFSFEGPPRWRTVTARVGVRGVRPGWSALATLSDATLDVGGTTLTGIWSRVPNDRTMVVSQGLGTISLAQVDGAAQQTLPDALGVRRIVSSNVGPVPGTIVFAIQDDVFSRHAPAVGRYTGRFWVSFTRHEIEAVLPLRTAASHRGDWYRFVIDGLELRSRMVTVRVRLSQATSDLARERYSAFNFYLRNLARGEAIEAESEYVRTDALLQRIMPFGISLGGQSSGFNVHRIVAHFPPRYRTLSAADQPVLPAIDDEWLRSAELVILRSTQEGAVRRTVEIAEFPLREASASAREF